jgi:hypothetical protein
MFAKLTGYFQTVDPSQRFILTVGWSECSWVETTREATKLSKQQVDRLVSELKQRIPSSDYTAERDETGETNQPPYGLDNFVVRNS